MTSSDPVEGRPFDWEITGPLTLNLRAELASPPKNSRIYTITVESVDDAGDASARAVNVTVPAK